MTTSRSILSLRIRRWRGGQLQNAFLKREVEHEPINGMLTTSHPCLTRYAVASALSIFEHDWRAIPRISILRGDVDNMTMAGLGCRAVHLRFLFQSSTGITLLVEVSARIPCADGCCRSRPGLDRDCRRG